MSTLGRDIAIILTTFFVCAFVFIGTNFFFVIKYHVFESHHTHEEVATKNYSLVLIKSICQVDNYKKYNNWSKIEEIEELFHGLCKLVHVKPLFVNNYNNSI